MEGTGREVSLEVFRHAFRAALLCSLVCLPPALHARRGGDFLMVEKAERLVVYNRYQQQATAEERRLLEPFTAMRILKADGLLADGFTRCMQVDISGETFFLLKDKSGKIARSGPLGIEQTFHNATLLLDTVQVLKSRSVRLYPINAPPVYLDSGEKLLRIFEYQARVYCGRPSNAPAYGWAALTGKGGGGAWKAAGPRTSRRSSIPDQVVEGVRSRVGETNRLLARLFEHFNTATHQEQEIPQWTVDSSRNLLSCNLRGTPHAENFDQSTLYLAKDIENLILGTDLKISHTSGRIEIQRP